MVTGKAMDICLVGPLLMSTEMFVHVCSIEFTLKVMGGCFRWRRYVGRYIGIYVCEQLPGANSSLIVTKLRQSYPWPQGTK